LASTRGQQKMAFSIFKAIREYKYELEGKTLTEAERNEKPVLTGKDEDDVVIVKPVVDTVKTIKVIKPNIVVVTPKDTAKPKLYTNPKNGTATSDAILFKIQLVSADKKIPLNSPAFKGNKTVEENFSDGFFRYTTTRAATLDEALKNLDSVKNEGFKDAFITAYKGKTKISVSEAKNMLNSLKN
jgi:hypothetical protein